MFFGNTYAKFCNKCVMMLVRFEGYEIQNKFFA